MKRIYFDKGGCDDGCNANANSYEDSLRGAQGAQGKQGIQGIDGKSSLINGSVTDGTIDSNGTADAALSATAVTNLTAMGFTVTTDSSLLATIDTSDTVNKKTWVRLSNRLFNLIGLQIQPKLLPTAGTSGNVLTSNGTIWTSSTPVNEIYNSTSPVNSRVIDGSIVGTNITFTVASSLLAYKFGIPIRFTDVASNANYIEGIVASYTGTSLVLNVTNVVGSGTPASWIVALGSLLNVPYISSSTANKVLVNNGSIPSWGDSIINTGYCMPWHGTTLPAGWLYCNGATFLESTHEELYKHLRPSNAVNAYAYAVGGGGSPYANGTARVPSYNRSAFPIGVSSTSDIGVSVGANSIIIDSDNLPETSPWALSKTLNGRTNYSGSAGTSYTLFNSSAFIATDAVSGYINGDAGTNTSPASDASWALGTNATNETPLDIKQLSEGCNWIIKY